MNNNHTSPHPNGDSEIIIYRYYTVGDVCTCIPVPGAPKYITNYEGLYHRYYISVTRQLVRSDTTKVAKLSSWYTMVIGKGSLNISAQVMNY